MTGASPVGPSPEGEDLAGLRRAVERFVAEPPRREADRDEARAVVARLLTALRTGAVRAAERQDGEWHAVPWVKEGILLAFRLGRTKEYRPFHSGANPAFGGSVFQWSDRATLPLRPLDAERDNIRVVPGGTSIRDGAYLASDVVLMPPAYVNIGAYVDEGAMIDSHALVGSCAQVGARTHVSAGAQLGGVLEPVGLRPVVLEEDVLVGGNAGVFEGTLVRRRAVIAPGVQLTRATPVFDLEQAEIYRATADSPLTIPGGAVVVPGARPATGDFAREHALQLGCAVIVKYRDEKTDAATALEDALR